MTRAAATDSGRRALLAQVHIARKELGLDEEAYRDVLERATGRRSAGDCDGRQLETAITAFKRAGWNGGRDSRRAGRSRLAASAHGRKARALWLALYQLGAVSDPGEPALDSFARRQTGIDSLAWLAPEKAGAVIDALKAWCAREGFQVPATQKDGGAAAKRALIRALWAKLCATGRIEVADAAALWRYLDKVCCMQVGLPRRAGIEHLDLKQLDIGIERLGLWLRRAGQGHGI